MTTASLRRCQFCGYDLRGSPSDVCPECGNARTVSLRIDDPEWFHRARALLERENLLVSFVDAGHAAETLYGTARSSGWLRVGTPDADRVEEMLDDLGIMWVEDGLATIDRAKPICPTCGHDLTDAENRQCAGCGGRFRWLENGDPASTEGELVCSKCFRNVMLVNGACPECGARHGEHAAVDARDDSTPHTHHRFSFALWVALSTGLSVPALAVLAFIGLDDNLGSWVAAALAIAGAVAYLILRKGN